MTTNDTDTISVGDQVGYRARDGDILGNDRGKVLGIFRTQDGKTLADVEWNGLGMPKRVGISHFSKLNDTNDRLASRSPPRANAQSSRVKTAPPTPASRSHRAISIKPHSARSTASSRTYRFEVGSTASFP